MSSWGMGWFGGAPARKKDAPKQAILQLRSTLEMLTKREKHLQHQADEQDAIARRHVASKNTAQAKQALRRKKQHEHTLEQTSAQMMTLEHEIQSIETANINKETLDAMKNASAAMKNIHGNLTIEKVDETMESLRDQHAIGEEIADAITQGAATSNALDDDELEDELAQMQQEQLDTKMLGAGNVPVSDEVHRLPAAGRAEPVRKQAVSQEEDEEEELKRLQAEMAM